MTPGPSRNMDNHFIWQIIGRIAFAFLVVVGSSITATHSISQQASTASLHLQIHSPSTVFVNWENALRMKPLQRDHHSAWPIAQSMRNNSRMDASKYLLFRTFGIESRQNEWLLVTYTNNTSTWAFGLLNGSTYGFRVCQNRIPTPNFTGGITSDLNCSLVTNITMTDAPNATMKGQIIAAGSRQYPRNGEGCMVRWQGELLLFLSRQTINSDVGASNVTLLRSSDNGVTWSPAVVVPPPNNHSPSRANPGAVVLNGTIVLSYFVGISADGKKSASRVVRSSTDGGHTWSAERNLTDGSFIYMTGAHDRMRYLKSGRIIIPVHVKLPATGASITHRLGTLLFTSDDHGVTWVKRGLRVSTSSVANRAQEPVQPLVTPPHEDASIYSGIIAGNCNEEGFYEASLAELTTSGHALWDGEITTNDIGRNMSLYAQSSLIMLARTCSGWLWKSTSTDDGTTWSTPTPTAFRHPLAPPNVVSVASATRAFCGCAGVDTLLLVTEPHFTGTGWTLGSRFVLDLHTSTDGDTWTPSREVEYTGDTAWFSYGAVYVDQQSCLVHFVYRCTPQEPPTFVSAVHQALPVCDVLEHN